MAIDNNDKLYKLRHSTAHLLAAAVEKLYPQALKTIGPVIENGFYYDFDLGDATISQKDLAKIEQTMHQLVKHWTQFKQIKVTYQQAKKLFANNPYKLELIEELHQQNQPLTCYQSGDFIDLCKGNHIDSPSQNIKHFKLLSVSGVHWRGQQNNSPLTRIYGTAFFTQKDLNNYLHQLAEAKKYDHKKLGLQLDLFTFSPLVGPGLPLWTPKGTLVRQLLDDYVWQLRQQKGYQKVDIPHLTKQDLYQTSGHWQKFKDELFKITTRDNHHLVIKPMNCPHHTQIYARKIHSYKELPQRYANTTMVYRDEQSGELHGLARVLSITQDDSHIFCRQSQISQEFLYIWDIVDTFYSTFDFKLKPRLSFSDPQHPEKYLGNPQDWQKVEQSLQELAQQRGVNTTIALGEAAFYGPKLDFMAEDSLGRHWQVATIQLDFNMPHRFGLYCINEQGQKEEIVMIHAAIMGSLERFIAMLLEHFKGHLPLWLAPTQLRLLPLSSQELPYAKQLQDQFHQHGLRVHIDTTTNTLSKKIVLAKKDKLPYFGIIGSKEVASQAITLQDRYGHQHTMPISQAIDFLVKQRDDKTPYAVID